jgi:Flp pilus assembly CpaF family ATPase
MRIVSGQTRQGRTTLIAATLALKQSDKTRTLHVLEEPPEIELSQNVPQLIRKVHER